MQLITPNLWFDRNAEEAAEFYIETFQNGKVNGKTHYLEAGFEIHQMPPGTVLTIDFEILGLRFTALNGGPMFQFTPAISFMVNCPTPEEVDRLWSHLSKGGTALMPLDSYPFSPRYGWTTDRFGLSWQVHCTDSVQSVEIVPALLFTNDACGRVDEAHTLYTSTFPDSSIGLVARYGAEQLPNKEGHIMYSDFRLAGQKFVAMESAMEHKFGFTEAVSFLVECADQAEIDKYWNALCADPAAAQCGWVKDKFGVSWQIVPGGMNEMLNSTDKEAANRAMNAMLQMKKIDIAALKAAFAGKQ